MKSYGPSGARLKRPPRSQRETSRPSWVWLLAILRGPIELMVRFRVFGGENVPTTGPAIIVPNHYSEIDPIIVGRALYGLGREPRFMAKAALFRVPVVGAALTAAKQIPVERGTGAHGNTALSAAKQIVDQRSTVIVYPEGTLTREPNLWPMRGKFGAARIALQEGIPVIPVAHWGTQQVMARYAKKISFFPRKTVTIKFGAPVDLEEFRNRPLDGSTLAAATERIMTAITSLLEELRHETAPAERWDPVQHNQTEAGRFDA